VHRPQATTKPLLLLTLVHSLFSSPWGRGGEKRGQLAQSLGTLCCLKVIYWHNKILVLENELDPAGRQSSLIPNGPRETSQPSHWGNLTPVGSSPALVWSLLSPLYTVMGSRDGQGGLGPWARAWLTPARMERGLLEEGTGP
jgi:hypothetical protein